MEEPEDPSVGDGIMFALAMLSSDGDHDLCAAIFSIFAQIESKAYSERAAMHQLVRLPLL